MDRIQEPEIRSHNNNDSSHSSFCETHVYSSLKIGFRVIRRFPQLTKKRPDQDNRFHPKFETKEGPENVMIL